MNYYDELIDKIEQLMKDLAYDEAKSLIVNELNLPYVPGDIEEKLNKYLSQIKEATNVYKSLSDDELLSFLKDNETKQLVAVNELNKRNLRDYIDLCDEYLKGKGFINAKALLVDSLIRQEINYQFSYVNDCSLIEFNPSKLKVIEETDDFIEALKIIEDNYMKNPSKSALAVELLYKEALLSLPNTINAEIVSEKIINYIDSAFSAN